MKLTDLITPATPSGTALFLRWEGYHVFSIPEREFLKSPDCVRFFGVGGKRHPDESLIDCALRESIEEIGAVVSRLESAAQTHFFRADGTVELIEISSEGVRPRLILEKRQHSLYGSMANRKVAYYLVGFDACLIKKPTPSSEIAAILYLQDRHLVRMGQLNFTLAELLHQGARVECQPNRCIDHSTVLMPHGTAQFLIQQLETDNP